jgi:hypothetical protein
MEKNSAVKTIVDSGQSRALLIQGINEGLVFLKGGNNFLKSLPIDKNLKRMAFTQILTSDETNLTLDRQTCEFEYAGDMINSGLIKFLPYGYESKSASGPNIIYPDLHALSEILDMHGESTSVEDLYNLYSEVGMAEEKFKMAFGKSSLLEIKLRIMMEGITSKHPLKEHDKEAFRSYERVTEQVNRIMWIVGNFAAKLERAREIGARISLDINPLQSITSSQDLERFSQQWGNSDANHQHKIIQTVCIELGVLPYRSTLAQTMKLRESSHFKSLREFSKDFLSNSTNLHENNLDKLAEEISYARRHINVAQKTGAFARFVTYVGVPFALATPLIPMLGGVGVVATFAGAYATAHQYAREKKFAWANIGAA